jgi:hypothetical protein
MIETGLSTLERRCTGEDLLTILDRNDTPRGKRMPIAATIDLINDGSIEISATQEVGVQRMNLEIVYRLVSGHERLAEHLPAVDLRATDVTTLTAKQVDLESLELELPQQICDAYVHEPATPRRFCITGLVVVY